jgi:hypothetical protein
LLRIFLKPAREYKKKAKATAENIKREKKKKRKHAGIGGLA